MEELLQIPLLDVRKLISAGAGDAALVYLYLRSGGTLSQAGSALQLSAAKLEQAAASLRQLGLLQKPDRRLPQDHSSVYTEEDVSRHMERDKRFSQLVGEIQRELGRLLSNEDLKILLGMLDYLDLPMEVVAILVHFCVERNRARGNLRAPSFRTMEKEAYRWADDGIDTMEQAAAFVQNQLQLQSQIGRVRKLLQLSDRRLTAAEEHYIRSWLGMGFDLPELQLAYERTCLNTGGLKWQYMNKILLNWDQKNLHTVSGIEAAERAPKGRPGQAAPAVSPMAKAAIARLVQEESRE